jgi:hypothetical protein
MIMGLDDYIWVGVQTNVKDLEGQGEEEDGSDQATKIIVKI